MAEQPGSDLSAEQRLAQELTCIHMIEVVMAETAAATGEMPQVPESELDLMLAECGQMFAEERASRSPESFQAMVACLDQAQSTQEFEACD